MMVLSRLLSAILALVPCLPLAAQEPPRATGRERYEECIERLPFRFHTEGRKALATTRTPEALQQLLADYRRPQAYEEHTRYTIVALLRRHFASRKWVDELIGFAASQRQPVDAWLWVAALQVEAEYLLGDRAMEWVQNGKSVLEQAAGIAALGRAKSDKLPLAIISACADFPRKDHERAMLLGAMSGAILANKRRANNDDFREGLIAYINLLDKDVKLDKSMTVQVARHLMWTLNAAAPFDSPEPWLNRLKSGDVKMDSSGRTVSGSSFFGIESEGERFCYVVDMSDSMCKDIDPDVRPKGPITGPKTKRKRGELPDQSDLPWHEIHTRFDLAREQLKISLQRLEPDQFFSVVWFGDGAGTLDTTPAMVKATRANVGRAIMELDSIELGPPDPPKAPDGVLRGKTNLHSGLKVAFGLHGRGVIDVAAYVAAPALAEGFDTIFILSDGAPSWDEFHVKDRDFGEGVAIIDPEYGEGAPRTPIMEYHGPYDEVEWLVEEVDRLNTFRRARIHCVGIGEANMRLMRRIAELGHGEVFQIGTK